MKVKTFKKYLILLVTYIVITRLIGYYGLRLYYTLADSPKMLPGTVRSFQSILTAFELFFNLIVVVLMTFELKSKKLTDWLIILLTLFRADIGIALFLFGYFTKSVQKKRVYSNKLLALMYWY